MGYARVMIKPAPVGPVAIGLDLSLVGTGAAVLVGGELRWVSGWTELKGLQQTYSRLLNQFKMKANTEADQQHRLDLITSWVCGVVIAAHKLGDVTVALEGYAFSKHSASISGLHELGGAVKAWLWSRGVPYRIYDPLSVKLAWTGKGTAEKMEMLSAAAHLYPALWDAWALGPLAESNVEVASNIADATLIAALLNAELELKAGRRRLDLCSASLRRVMIRTTRSEPEALVSRAFVGRSGVAAQAPSWARVRLA